MTDFLNALTREDVLFIFAAIGLIVLGIEVGVLHGRINKLRAELVWRKVLDDDPRAGDLS